MKSTNPWSWTGLPDSMMQSNTIALQCIMSLCTHPAKVSWSLVCIDSQPLVAVSAFLRVIVNKSTLGLFNDAGCHGNSLPLYSDGEKKKGAAGGLRGAEVYYVSVCVCGSGIKHI